MSWMPTDLYTVTHPISSLLIFIVGSMTWDKLKPTGISLRFALLLSLCVAVVFSAGLSAIEAWVLAWI